MAVFALLASVGLTIAGEVSQGNAAANAASLQAKQASENARLSLEQSARDESDFRVYAGKQLGSMRANMNASGFAGDASGGDVLRDSASRAEMDAQKIRYGGMLKARGFQNDADLASMKSQYASEGGYLSAAGTLLRSGAQFAAGKYDY